MIKYFQIFKLTLQEYFEYRLNFILWRFRSFVSFLTLIIFWEAIYGSKATIFGYEKSQMITYVIGIAFLRAIVLGSRSADLAGQIRSGELTKIIQKPWGLFPYWLSKDIADKLLNLVFTVAEVFFAVRILNLEFYFPQKVQTYFFFLIILLLAVFLYFFLSFAISVTSFWTDDIWATRWLLGIILLEFMAGTYFPIDILPKIITKIINFTPFPYLVYFPIKVWNEQITGGDIFKVISICFLWLVVFYMITIKLWKRGVRNYGAYGG